MLSIYLYDIGTGFLILKYLLTKALKNGIVYFPFILLLLLGAYENIGNIILCEKCSYLFHI